MSLGSRSDELCDLSNLCLQSLLRACLPAQSGAPSLELRGLETKSQEGFQRAVSFQLQLQAHRLWEEPQYKQERVLREDAPDCPLRPVIAPAAEESLPSASGQCRLVWTQWPNSAPYWPRGCCQVPSQGHAARWEQRASTNRSEVPALPQILSGARNKRGVLTP